MDYHKQICKFLNISLRELLDLDSSLVFKLVEAVKAEDFFKLHHLGYDVRKEVKVC